MVTTDTSRPLLTIPEVAERLNISTSRAWQLAQRGELPVIRIGRSVRVSEEGLAAFVFSRLEEPKQ